MELSTVCSVTVAPLFWAMRHVRSEYVRRLVLHLTSLNVAFFTTRSINSIPDPP